MATEWRDLLLEGLSPSQTTKCLNPNLNLVLTPTVNLHKKIYKWNKLKKKKQKKDKSHCTPTLLSELGIMASVIQEPKRDPEALTVMGLLTAVRRPHPVNK